MTQRVAACCLVLCALVVTAVPVSAKILKTRKSSQAQGLAVTFGSGVEYESDSDQSEYGFPFLFEYGMTKRLKLTVEPQYTVIRSTEGDSVSGPGDLETTLTFDLVPERRYRPLFSAEGLVKWQIGRASCRERVSYSV